MSVLTLLDLSSAFDTIGHHSLLGGNVAGKGGGVQGIQYYDYIIIISEILKVYFLLLLCV